MEYETKFILNNSAAYTILTWLKGRCYPDRKYPEGIVNSIYYDTRGWSYLYEKINSDYLKSKIRLRWYSDIHTARPVGNAFLEMKNRVGYTRKKIRIKTELTGELCEKSQLESKDLTDVPYQLYDHNVLYGKHLLPVFQISYKRYRFIDPLTQCRINLDFDISAPRVNKMILKSGASTIINKAVFEIKGDDTILTESLFQLTALGCKKESFSKYSTCYEKLLGLNCLDLV